MNRLKVAVLRLYYRFINWWNWRGGHPRNATSTLQVPGPAGPIAARLYTADATDDRPLILYFHGGGWVIGDLNTHHAFCEVLSQRCKATVLAVDYRLAPEHPWPAAEEDCLAAAEWVAVRLPELGPGNGRLVIAGDSAGGNLCAITCLSLSDAARATLAGAVTIYPAVDHYQSGWLSYRERSRSRPLTFNLMRWFWDTYLAGTAPEDAFSARPLHSQSLATMPPLFNITAEYDPLRDEGRAFGKAVAAAGVPTRQRHFERAAHDFACSGGPNRDFLAFIDDLQDWLATLT
jgi:acetyl esterase